MKKKFYYSLTLLWSALLATLPAHALIGPALTTGGSDTTTFTGINAKQFQRSSGTWFAAQTTGAGDNAICYATRPSTADLAPTFTGIAGSSTLSNIEFLSLSVIDNPTTPTDPTTAYIVTTSNVTATGLYCFTGTAQNNDPQLAILTDGGGVNTTKGTTNITGGLYDGVGYAFASVLQNSTSASFGASSNDGIALAQINPTTLAMTTSTIQCNASAALSMFSTGTNGTASGGNYPTMFYDATFGNLYVALDSLTSSTICAVARFAINPDTPKLENASFVTGNNFATVFNALNNQVVGYAAVGSSGTATISIPAGLNRTFMQVMHTSTSPAVNTMNYAYLIMYVTTDSLLSVYAVPLVTNNATATNNGMLADAFTYDTHPFDTPVAVANHLYTTSSNQACVGNGEVPGEPADMWVDGDTVYISISGVASTNNCPGLWKSQAMFDNLGRISYWSDWEKVTPVGYDVTGSDNQSSINMCAVDAYTGQIWAVDSSYTNLYVTGWNNTNVATDGLVGFLNSNLSGGCFSTLDLNASVTGWGANTPIRMAAFGGVNTVCFALTGSASYDSLSFSNGVGSSLTNTATTVLTDAYVNSLTDYTVNDVGLVTTGLPGRVNCLGYSGWSANNSANPNPGFILAGIQPEAPTDGALYAYVTAAGNGFNATTQITPDLASGFFDPSNDNSWQQLTNVVGTPVKISSRGGALYVLTQSVTDEGRTDYIYRATICSTLNTLNNSFIAIATSGTAPYGADSSLAAATRFYDFVISTTVGGTTVAPTGAEQLLLLTDDGIYTTTCANGTQTNYGPSTTPTTLQLNAGWEKVDDATNSYVHMNISEVDRQRSPGTFWSSSFVQNADTPFYNSNVMTQGSITYDNADNYNYGINPSADKPGMFNSDSTTSFQTLPLLYSIYSDGNRRFVVYAQNINQHYLVALPYNVDVWNVTDPQAPINSSVIQGTNAYYWIAQIGSTGMLMAGTNNGVIALQ